MFKHKQFAGLIILLLSSLVLEACGAGAPQTPTVDPNMIYTAAAQTVEAQLTMAVQNAPPTEAPTLTSEPTQTVGLPTLPGVEASATLLPLGVTPLTPLNGTPTLPAGGIATLAAPITTPGVPVVGTATLPGVLPAMPTATATTGSTGGCTKECQLMSQAPCDGSQQPPGINFDMTWRIKNIGTRTWTKKFWYGRLTGDRIGKNGAPDYYALRADVKPNETYDIIVDMYTGNIEGKYNTIWVLNDENYQCICLFSLEELTIKKGSDVNGDTCKYN